MTPTPVPTLPISIYPETWEKSGELLNQLISPDVLAGILIGLLILVGFVFLVRRIRHI